MQLSMNFHMFAIFFLLGASVSTSFTTRQREEPEVSPVLLAQLKLFSQYSAASYCDPNTQNGKGALIKCPGVCPLVEAANATVFDNFFNIGTYDTAGFLALDSINKHLVLVFRGAEFNGAAAAFASQLLNCSAICSECRCAEGFYTSWLAVRDQVKASVAAAQAVYPDFSFSITGHSLGAVQSVYAAAEFRANGTNALLFTYGQPRAGNIALAELLEKQGQSFRITHTVDPAPRLPPNGTELGYVHSGPEYWIFQDEDENFSVSTGQIQVLRGINNTAGNEGQHVYDESAHVEYFQPQIALCYTSIPPASATRTILSPSSTSLVHTTSTK